MEKSTIQITSRSAVEPSLYNYLFIENNFILGGKKLFRGITHVAQYGLRVKNITAENPRYKKMLRAEFQRVARGIKYVPLVDPKAIIAFKNYIWKIVKLRSVDICPHKEVCDKCPLASSCRSVFDARFDLTY